MKLFCILLVVISLSEVISASAMKRKHGQDQQEGPIEGQTKQEEAAEGEEGREEEGRGHHGHGKGGRGGQRKRHQHTDPETEWNAFKQKKEKRGHRFRSPEQERERKEKFRKNHAFIMKHNDEADEGKHTFDVGTNEFSDLEPQEFKQKLNGFRPNKVNKHKNRHHNKKKFKETKEAAAAAAAAAGAAGAAVAVAETTTAVPELPTVAPVMAAAVVGLPESVDWRDKGYVTEVKNQGECGDCWAFSTTGSLEGQHFKSTGKLVDLSEQNLVDCVYSPDSGCDGGDYNEAFAYIATEGGVNTEESYPYTALMGTNCGFKKDTVGALANGSVSITPGSEAELLQAVATVGPISVALAAGNPSFQLYATGVYQEPLCAGQDVDHAMLLVGYGTSEDGINYWIIKNSWGTTWGMNGYMHLLRNGSNECGIATLASYPTVP